jgi:hypothetical protein
MHTKAYIHTDIMEFIFVVLSPYKAKLFPVAAMVWGHSLSTKWPLYPSRTNRAGRVLSVSLVTQQRTRTHNTGYVALNTNNKTIAINITNT